MERLTRNASRVAIGLALMSVLILIWMIGALGIIADEGDRVDLLYGGVLVVGVVGVALARFRPHGMARTLYAMAATQAIIALIAIVGGLIPAYNTVYEILGLNAMFVGMFAGSALLFRRAAEQNAGTRSIQT